MAKFSTHTVPFAGYASTLQLAVTYGVTMENLKHNKKDTNALIEKLTPIILLQKQKKITH